MKRSVIAVYVAAVVFIPVAVLLVAAAEIAVVAAIEFALHTTAFRFDDAPLVAMLVIVGTVGSYLGTLGSRMVERRFRRTEDTQAARSAVDAFL